MRCAGGQGMEPATLDCLPGSGIVDDNLPSREKTNTNENTTRRGKLKLRINVQKLRNALSEMELQLSGLKQKHEANPIGEQRSLKRSPKSILKTEPIKDEIANLGVSEIDADEKDIVPERDVGFMPHKQLSKLPVLDKSKFDEMPKVTTDILTKVVGLETLYGVLMEEHLGLQLTLQETCRRLRSEERRARDLEERRNPINLALAERIGLLQAEAEGLRRTVAELREENDLLEFRLLEMDELPIRKTVYRSIESTRYDAATDIDDVSDSGVMSLPASDDEHADFSMEAKSEGDVKSRLLSLSQTSAVGDRICIQQGLALLRHQEARIEALESTIAAMCHEATLTRNLQPSESGPARIIATVLPFTERKDSCLQESGIFEEGETEWASRGTQTEAGPRSEGDLSTELEKLSRIREKMETASLQPQELPPGKQLAYYRSRVETLESRLEMYEARDDDLTKMVKVRLEKEARLEAEVSRLRERTAKLERENRDLEEERCELEEAENDTRLRCQKLEFKLSALGETKSCLKAQLEQLTHEMATREEEKNQKMRMEAIVQNYEKKNHELEERELELRYRLQMLENTLPALMMWNMWRMMVSMQGQNPAIQGVVPTGGQGTVGQLPAQGVPASTTLYRAPNPKEEELVVRLKALENRLEAENRMLQDSRNAEEMLRNKIRDLESVLDSKDTNILEILDREPETDIEAFEKLSKMAKERVEMDRRIRELELREKMYQETLQQVDSMFSELEGKHGRELLERERVITDQGNKLADVEQKLKHTNQISEINLQLQEKLTMLEIEMQNLTDSLKKRELEREALEEEEKRLNEELQECLLELDTLKQQIEGPMKGQLEVQRKRNLVLEEELEKFHSERLNMKTEHKTEMKSLEKKINNLSKELMESDVTIGELKEEVQTLENAIGDLRCLMSLEKADKEDMKKSFEAKLEEKERQFEELKESLKIKAPEKSLKEEFEEMMYQSHSNTHSDMAGDTSVMNEVAEAIKFFYQDAGDNHHSESRNLVNVDDETEDITSHNYKMTGKRKEKVDYDMKLKTVHALEGLLSEVCQREPLLDYESTKGTLQTTPLNNQSIPVVCKSCNETLGLFLGDIIKEFEVQLPNTNVLGNRQL